MDLIHLNQELMKQYERLEREKNALFRLGKEKADAEREYRKALYQEILILRDQKLPATLISDLARGSKRVSDLKFARDAADTTYRAALASMEATRSQSSILKELYDKHEEI
jgi:hypothetical protein